MTVPIRVLIADDHPIVRSGLRGELAYDDEVEVVGEALSGDEALRLAQERQPDVLLLDVNMPGMKAIQVLKEVKRSLPACRVLVLTAYGDSGTVLGMLKGGADGYLLKDEDPLVIHEAVRAVAGGETWVSQAVSRQLALLAREEAPLTGATLTQREREVMELIVAGKTNVDIAQTLSLAERTVEFHVSNLLKKLGVRSRVEAAVWAKEHLDLID
jgi:DNA-binding NarL/FixJ family response regulator